MYVDNEYDISIPFRGEEHFFRIKTLPPDEKSRYMVFNIDNTIDADVWQKYDLYFTLDATPDNIDGTLTLSPEYRNKGIEPELVNEIANIVKNAAQR